MVYNDEENKSGLIQMIGKSLGYGSADITGNASRFAYINNLINMWTGKVANIIWGCSKNWYFDDSNQTDLPVATTTLVHNQSDYLLPTSLLRMNKVEVMDANGKYYEVELIKQDNSKLKDQQYQETASSPSNYYITGRSLMLYPKPDTSQVTLVKGLRLTFDRQIKYFAVTDTTKEPGFSPDDLHWIIVYGVVFHCAGMKEAYAARKTAKEMLYEKDGLIDQLKARYATRDRDDTTRITSNFARESFE